MNDFYLNLFHRKLARKTAAIAAEGRRLKLSVWYIYLNFMFLFDSTSLSAVLSSHDRCVTYRASNLTMVLHSSLKIPI